MIGQDVGLFEIGCHLRRTYRVTLNYSHVTNSIYFFNVYII